MINKILISLLLLIFISGCAELEEFVGKTTTTTVGEVSFMEKPETIQDEFVMYIGDEITVNEKLIILRDILTNGEVTIFVDGIEEVIETTRNPEIVNELEIITEEINYGSEKSGHHVKLKIFPLELGKDEHYLKAGDKVKIGDLVITFKDLNKLNSVKILIEGKEFLLPLKEILIVRSIKITNKRAFNSGFRNKRSVILQIETFNSRGGITFMDKGE